MDERYFLYLEDTDLCKRMWQSGWKVKAIPTVKLVHAHQRASKKSFGRAGRQHLKSLVRFWGKHGLPVSGHGLRA